MHKPTGDCHLRYFGRPRREATTVWGMESLFIQCKDQHSFICSIFKTQGIYFLKPLMEKAAGWRCLFQKEKHSPVVYLQASFYQGLHLSPCCFSWLQSDLKCSVDGKELRAISGCSHSQTSAHPNSIPGVCYTSQLHSNTQGQQGRMGKLFPRHLHLVLIVREPFGCMGGIHTFAPGKRRLGLHADIFWEENTAGKMRFSSSLGLC